MIQIEKPVLDDGLAEVGTTPNGKVLQLKVNNNNGFIKIQYADGGELPKELSGIWNNFDQAFARCKSYLEKKYAEAEKKSKKVEDNANSIDDKEL